MQKTIVVTYCDVDYIDDDAAVDAEVFYYPGMLPDGGDAEIHLCPQHHKEIETKLSMVEVRNWLARYGRPVMPEGKPKQKRRSPTYGEYSCRWCEHVSPTAQGKGAHEAHKHPKEFAAAKQS
jgi:hypothetical protein